ncbi:MAG: hypothetical protein K9M55_11830, partial [Candidatus Marinimicrobia bacterium]|nr:hypothetical protein [Candidatus Neomarinimicrobiota bacterium]
APQIAGLAALLLQAHPQLAPDSVISIFQDYGDRVQTPDNSYGWGIPNLTSLFPMLHGGGSKNCLIYPNPVGFGEIRMVLSHPISHLPEMATLYDIRGREIAALRTTQESGNIIKIYIPSSLNLTNQLLIISVKTNTAFYSGKFIHLR